MKLSKILVVMATVVSLECSLTAQADGGRAKNLFNFYEIDEESLLLLAKCVDAEAGNQDLYGKQLVADVILNRVDSERFPDDVESVITQKYHFSTYWDGSIDKIAEPSEESYEAVCLELQERTDDEILFFSAGDYSIYCKPAYKYGDHYFGY